MNAANKISKKGILCQNILNNHKKNLENCFEKYRCFNEQNCQFRATFYTIIKKQIISSLNIYEKINLLQEIQHDIYSNSQSSYSYEVTPACHTEFADSLSGPSDSDYQMEPTNRFRDQQVDQSILSNEPTFIARSGGSPGDGDQERLKLQDLSISSSGKDNDDGHMNMDLCIVRESFQRLSNLITEGAGITGELDRIKKEHGEHIYSRVVTYSPVSCSLSPANGEPIVFQLALQLPTYEFALDRLVDENLLDLNQRNQYRMSIFNVLLVKDFHSFTKFLSYIDRKNLDHTIQHVCVKNDYIAQLPEMGKDSGPVSVPKDLEIITNEGDEYMVAKGIIYCRQLIKNRNARIVSELLSHNYLHAVLNDQIGNDQPFLKQLAETYPDSDPEIQLIIKEDSDAVVHSPFIVWLALRNLNNFYVFLRDLIKVIQINKRDLCRAIVDQNVDGKTIPTIIQADEYKNRFPKSAKRIEEFILNYKSENAK